MAMKTVAETAMKTIAPERMQETVTKMQGVAC